MSDEELLNNNIISKKAYESIIFTKKKNEQTMIFINRRGYSRTLKCADCGYEAKCQNCDNLLSYHKNKNFLKCHYCGYKLTNICKCQKCNSKNLAPHKGYGVEQVEKEVKSFSQNNSITLNTIIFSSDEIHKENDADKISQEIKEGNIDVIIGTQIITKGHHFPRLTNIIILDIDGALVDGNFRAKENIFQLLFQLSGRAGREKKNATVYIQTMNKQNKVLLAIKNHDIRGFYKSELAERKKFNLPPYSRFISIIVSSEIKEMAYNTTILLEKEIKKNIPTSIEIFGPIENTIHYLKRKYRYRFLLKTPKKSFEIFNILNNIRENFKCPKKVQIKFDVDCYDFS